MSRDRPFRPAPAAPTKPRQAVGEQQWGMLAIARLFASAAAAQDLPSPSSKPCCGSNGNGSSDSEPRGFVPPTNGEIKLDRFFYESGSRVSATVWVRDVALLRRDAMRVVLTGKPK